MPEGTAVAVVRLASRQLRRSSLAWAAGFGVVVASTIAAYESAYQTEAERIAFARVTTSVPALTGLLGEARRVDTTGGFVTWRAGGLLMVVAGVWALLAVTRLLRGEEEAGRGELVRAGAISPAGLAMASLISVGLWAAVIGVVVAGATAASGLGLGGSVAFGGEIALVAACFGSIGAVTSQLFDTRRRAASAAAITLGVAFGVRVAADGTRTNGWLRWATPLGWGELIHPFSGSSWPPAAILAVSTTLLTVVAVGLAGRRDLGAAILNGRDEGSSHFALLGSPEGLALRTAVGALGAWTVGVGAFAALAGVLAVDVARLFRTTPTLAKLTDRMGMGDFRQPSAYLGYVFATLAVAVSIETVMLISRAAEDESSGRLDVSITGSATRVRWLLARVWAAVLVTVVTAAVFGAIGWAAAARRGFELSFLACVRGGLNSVPAAVLFGGLVVLGHGLRPRLGAAAGVGGALAGYVLQLVGSAARLSHWVLDLSPYHHVAAVPAVPANVGAAAVLLAGGVLAGALGTVAITRRDLEIG